MFVEQIQNGLELKDIAENIVAVFDTSLLPGESIPLHFHPDYEELYYVLSGYGIMTIGDDKQEIVRNYMVYIPHKTSHALINTAAIPS